MRTTIILVISLFFIYSCSSNNSNNNKETEIIKLNEFINNWHHAAAVADENVFFGSLDENAVYLGTDSKERWLKHEFMNWGIKYFEQDTAWSFTPYNRFWEFSEDMNYAWFDELLNTHMGICRGSGVLVKCKDGWKIKHYNLALTLRNEQMNEYRNLINKK
jgi:hypothetical protein